MKCNHCGSSMDESTTTFTVVREHGVYVVKNVPCLECPVCEDVSFSSEVAKKLERYTSGRAIPVRAIKSWVFNWGEPIVEIPKTESPSATVNTQLALTVSGTSPGG